MSFLSMCIHSSAKTEKARKSHHHHHSRRGPGHSVAPILGQLVPTNVAHLDEPIVRKHPPLVEENENEDDCVKPAGRETPNNRVHRRNCENATCSSTTSSHTSSGYQTDDGTFEGKILRSATRSKPANIRMTALKDYNPCCTEELVLRRGQRVVVLYKKNDWVYAVTKTGEAGYVPYNYVRPSRKYAGYQSEPEYAGDTDYYQSGYDTDLPVSGHRRYGTKTQIGDHVPSYSIRTGPENVPQRHGSHGSGGNSPPSGSRIPHRYANGYTSAVEYSTTPELSRRHPRPAKSLHSIADAGDVSPTGTDRRPAVGKPGMDSFARGFLEELVVIHDFEVQEEDEVFISKGERVKVMNAEDPFWLWVETTAGMQGFVPRSCCSLGNHPYLQSNSTRRKASVGSVSGSRNAKRSYHQNQRTKAQLVARQSRSQAKQRFHELARQRNTAQNPMLMSKEEIQRVGSKLIVLMDYTATQNDELDIQFAETVYADVLKQAGAERIWTYCPRSEQCGFVPISLLVPPVV